VPGSPWLCSGLVSNKTVDSLVLALVINEIVIQQGFEFVLSLPSSFNASLRAMLDEEFEQLQRLVTCEYLVRLSPCRALWFVQALGDSVHDVIKM
jgi:hypothetical protein